MHFIEFYIIGPNPGHRLAPLDIEPVKIVRTDYIMLNEQTAYNQGIIIQYEQSNNYMSHSYSAHTHDRDSSALYITYVIYDKDYHV